MEKELIEPMIFDLKEQEKLAKAGNGLACYILARSYDSQENDAEQSFEKAVYWYSYGNKLNDPRCTYGLAACYYFGDGVEKDLNKAHKLFSKAYKSLLRLIEEDKDNPKVQSFSKFCLGAYYYFGFGDIKEDKNKAFDLIHECAMQGHIAAIYDLGANFYYYGVGTEKNLEQSKYYLELAASVGLPRAKRKLLEYQDDYNKIVENHNKKQ